MPQAAPNRLPETITNNYSLVPTVLKVVKIDR